ncbi:MULTISPECIES: nitrate reductase cytochrome c-type subunit [unclassified Nitratiruptor]|uniref:nitrate reductase cytochrome c-type subunit n=1 Tax=unclassified Nitratiruptor TaxID=2624044 RepID=UPI001916BBEE|nr:MULTISPECIES: nitrate reductase cytochrome c-type subunit [unclassified Nitratiruptor]BCD61084.1 cytochrome c-type protein NapB [Nitratiruptor sp. YY08-10]BCD65017.1 cytochrome c-type protein NapB [Nitratiruptor sp. YY08-14]
MKLKKLVGLSATVAIFLAAGCGAASQKVVSEHELSYGSRGVPPKVEYSKAAPGTAKKFQRSYENAPPLIPHSIDGLVPITLNNNACLGCHMPSVAKSMGATPLPPTHFKDFFFKTKEKLIKQKLYEDVKAYKRRLSLMAKKEDIAPQRYNCVQCHVPQANAKPLVANTFKPDFRDPNAKHRSKLYKNLMEGVK